jgi:hypothetical protein
LSDVSSGEALMSFNRERGLALAMVLTAMLIALSLWTVSYHTLSNQVQLEERAAHGSSATSPPGLADAIASAISCLRVSHPSSYPYQCLLTLGQGTNQQTFLMTYTQVADKTVWLTVTSSPTQTGFVACPSCGGGTP